ncbi:unnamed protein product, partial [Cylindrotheca closterium]
SPAFILCPGASRSLAARFSVVAQWRASISRCVGGLFVFFAAVSTNKILKLFGFLFGREVLVVWKNRCRRRHDENALCCLFYEYVTTDSLLESNLE